VPARPGPRECHHDDFEVVRLVEVKGDHHVSVCLPARDEEATVGRIVAAVRRELVESWPLVDEVVVVDDGSGDRTARAAADAGARVVAAADVLPEWGAGPGKGDAMWKSLHVCKGDVVVWCDADVRNFSARFVTGLLGPLLLHDGIGFVKARYARPLAAGATEGGGRVTELVARPAISLLFPELAGFAQPLAGECAGRREVLERVPFARGYGVDVALLLDVVARFGVASVAQVDLGARLHRNRPLAQLAEAATAVLHAALTRAGVDVADPPGIEVGERPPLVDVAAYRQRP
jgi:glucosyl-3-phosphoglycerate synthase